MRILLLTIDRHFLDLGKELIFIDHQLSFALLVAQLNLIGLANDLAGLGHRKRSQCPAIAGDDVIRAYPQWFVLKKEN